MRLNSRPLFALSFLASALSPAALSASAQATASNPAPVNFGSQAVGVAQTQVPVTFSVTDQATLAGAPLVLTQGAPNLDFTLGAGSTCAGSVAAGTCTVNVVFTPKAPGQRLGAVQLVDGNGSVVATAMLYGTGSGAAAVFPTNTSVAALGNGFSAPQALAVDAAGNVYVGDGRTVYKVMASGGNVSASSPVNTLASGFSSVSDLKVDGAGNVYVADRGSNAVYEIVAPGGNVSATPQVLTLGSGFSQPRGLALDSLGNVYVADFNNASVKKIVAVNGSVPSSNQTVQTLGSGMFAAGIAVDAAGNVFVTDSNSGALDEIVAGNGASMTVNTGSFAHPAGMAMDAAGNVYVADSGALYQVVAAGGSVSSNSPVLTLASGLRNPQDIAVDGAGNVYFTQDSSSTVFALPLSAPPVLTFPTTAINNSSQALTFGMQNVGNAPLTFPVPSSGQNPSLSPYFTLGGSSTCPVVYSGSQSAGVLNAGMPCTESLTFTPTASGSVTGNLTFTDNSLTNTTTTQTEVMTGSSVSALSMMVPDAIVLSGTNSMSLTFILGWGGNAAPTGTPVLTVNGSASGTGSVSCTGKAGHKNCTATYDPSALAPGTYTISATETDSTYGTTTGSGTLTVWAVAQHVNSPRPASPIGITAPATTKSVVTGTAASPAGASLSQPTTVAQSAFAPNTFVSPTFSADPLFAAPALNLNSDSDGWNPNDDTSASKKESTKRPSQQ